MDSPDKSAINIAKELLEPLTLTYHNLDHAKHVSNVADELANLEEVTEHERKLIQIAAWYHDVGHIYSSNGHEIQSVRIARKILQGLGYSSEDIERIKTAILATRVPQEPQSDVVAQIIGDADLATLGFDYPYFYKERMKAYREWSRPGGPEEWREKGTREWNRLTGLPLIESQSFMTDAATDKYRKQMQNNYERLVEEVESGPPTVLVGGTFRIFHAGHYKLLETAFGYGNPVIGITSDKIAKSTRDGFVQRYEKRKQNVKLSSLALRDVYQREFQIKKLTKTVEIAAKTEADIIVISPEEKTMERTKEINEKRVENGLEALEVIVSEEVRDEEGNRISATRIQNEEIDVEGNLIESS